MYDFVLVFYVGGLFTTLRIIKSEFWYKEPVPTLAYIVASLQIRVNTFIVLCDTGTLYALTAVVKCVILSVI